MKPIRLLTLTLLAGASFAALSAQDHAEAACELATGGSGNMPMSGAVVNCVDNLDPDGVVSGTASAVTVDVQGPSGGISTTGEPGVLLGNGAMITVSGQSNRPINTSGDLAAGIDVQNGAMITVDGQVTTSGGTSPGITTGDMSTVEIGQSGRVSTGGGMSPSISVGANSTVTIAGDGGDVGGRVTTGNSNSDAVLLRGEGSTLTVENGAVVTTSSGMSSPVKVDGADGTVNVSGDVRSSSGDSDAISGTAEGLTVNVRDGGFVTAQSSNSNAIDAIGDGAEINVESGGEVAISSGNSVAINVGANAQVNVAGTVQASSSQSQGVVIGDGSTLTMQSGGVIKTSSSESQAVLINADAETATVNVERGGEIDAIGAQAIVDEGMTDTEVTVDGIVFGGSSEPVIDMGAGDDTVTVNGTVRATSADPVIDLGDGNDTFNNNSSQTVEGPGTLVAGGGGEDTLNLANGEENDASRYTGFEETNVGRNMNADDPQNGMETTLNVNDDQSGNTINANEGGQVNVNDGGTATIGSGEGNVDVNEGGTANVTADNAEGTGSGQSGGTINFDEGSTADVASNGGSSETQTFTGTTFNEGSRVSVNNSDIITGTAGGNQVVLGIDAGRFAALTENGTDNARSFGDALDAALAANPDLLDEGIDNGEIDLRVRGSDAQALLSLLSGEIAVQAAAGGIATAQAFADQLRPTFAVNAVTGGTFGLALDVDETLGADLSPTVATPVVGRTGVWLSAFGTYLDVDADRSSDFDATGGGFAVGVQREVGFGAFDSAVIGLAGGYSNTDVDGAAVSSDVEAYHLGIYAAGEMDALQLSSSLAYAWVDLGSDAGGADGGVFTAQAEVAYNLGTFGGAGISVAPLARIAYTYADFDDSRPIGPLGVVAGGDMSQTIGALGVRFGKEFTFGTVSLEASYEHAFGDEAIAFSNTLTGADPFRTAATVADESSFNIGLDTRFNVTENTDLTLGYDGSFGDEIESHTGTARLTFRF